MAYLQRTRYIDSIILILTVRRHLHGDILYRTIRWVDFASVQVHEEITERVDKKHGTRITVILSAGTGAPVGSSGYSQILHKVKVKVEDALEVVPASFVDMPPTALGEEDSLSVGIPSAQGADRDVPRLP